MRWINTIYCIAFPLDKGECGWYAGRQGDSDSEIPRPAGTPFLRGKSERNGGNRGLLEKITRISILSILFSLPLGEGWGGAAHAQNLEKIGQKDMVTVGGNLSLNAVFYDAWNMDKRRDPFSWFFNGTLNVNILDVSLPFTYSYTNHQGNYTQPFNMTSCTPTWKWIKAYIGQTSMTFSPYTLAGHVFAGGGIELTPGKWKIMGMYGRLNKAVEYNSELNSDVGMAYRRMGYGGKVNYEDDKWGAGINYFAAADDPASLLFVPPVTSIRPMKNTALGLNGHLQITKEIKWDAEFAVSGVTSNSQAVSDSLPSQVNYLPLIYKLSSTSRFYTAGKSSLTYSTSSFNLGVSFERVSPGYITLGGYYFNNDLQNITLVPQFKLLKGRLNVGLNTGYQKNNLNHQKMNTTHRWIGNINVSYAPNQKWMLAATYSNFTSYTRQRPVTDPFYQLSPADTLNFYQLSQTATFVLNHNWGGKKIKQNLSFNTNYTVATQQTSGTGSVPVEVYNANAGYNLNFVPTKWIAGITANYNRTTSGISRNEYLGPGVNVGKALLNNKLRVTGGSVYNLAFSKGQQNGMILNNRLAVSYAPTGKAKIGGKPNVSLAAMHVMRVREGQTNTNELTVTVNLGYSF